VRFLFSGKATNEGKKFNDTGNDNTRKTWPYVTVAAIFLRQNAMMINIHHQNNITKK
jgi:hypothetical protein